MIPTSHIASALRNLGATGLAIEALRHRTIVAPLAAHDAAIAPTVRARSLTAITADVGRSTVNIVRKVQP